MTCPNCGSPLSSTTIEVRLTCACGYSEPTIPNAETLGTFASVGEDLLSSDLIEA